MLKYNAVCVHERVTDRVCAGPRGEGSQNQLQCSQRRPLFQREPHKSQRSSAEEGSKSWRTIYLNFLHSATPRGRRHTQQLLSQLFSGDPPSAPGLIWSVVICSSDSGNCDTLRAQKLLISSGIVLCRCTARAHSCRFFLYSHFEFNTSSISGCSWLWGSGPRFRSVFCFWLLLLLHKLVKRKRDAFGHFYWTCK